MPDVRELPHPAKQRVSSPSLGVFKPVAAHQTRPGKEVGPGVRGPFLTNSEVRVWGWEAQHPLPMNGVREPPLTCLGAARQVWAHRPRHSTEGLGAGSRPEQDLASGLPWLGHCKALAPGEALGAP